MNLDDNMVTFLGGPELHLAFLRFADLTTLFRCFDAMVNRIANDVHEWIRDVFNNQLVELCVGATDVQINSLALLVRNATDNPGHLVKQLANRHHANVHDTLLQLVEATFQDARRFGKLRCNLLICRSLNTITNIGDRTLGEDQFTDNIHQQIELVDVDPDSSADRTHGTAAISFFDSRRQTFRSNNDCIRHSIRLFKYNVFRLHRDFNLAVGAYIKPFSTQQKLNVSAAQLTSEKNLEGDFLSDLSGRGQSTDDLTLLLQLLSDFGQLLIKTGQIEIHAQKMDSPAFANIFKQTMFFVFG